MGLSPNTVRHRYCRLESFELLLKFGKSSFLRKQESSLFKTFWIPAYAGMTKWGYFSKFSMYLRMALLFINFSPLGSMVSENEFFCVKTLWFPSINSGQAQLTIKTWPL